MCSVFASRVSDRTRFLSGYGLPPKLSRTGGGRSSEGLLEELPGPGGGVAVESVNSDPAQGPTMSVETRSGAAGSNDKHSRPGDTKMMVEPHPSHESHGALRPHGDASPLNPKRLPGANSGAAHFGQGCAAFRLATTLALCGCAQVAANQTSTARVSVSHAGYHSMAGFPIAVP